MLCSIYTCQNKVSTDQYHMTISGAQVFFLSAGFSIGSRAQARSTCSSNVGCSKAS